jgi:hypothetical protein
MKSKAEIEDLEKLIGQLDGLHSEISQLAKKSPNDGLNTFKLKFQSFLLSTHLGRRFCLDTAQLPVNSVLPFMHTVNHMIRSKPLSLLNVLSEDHRDVANFCGHIKRAKGTLEKET